MAINNVDEYELLDILLKKYKSIVIEYNDRDRPFLDKMCHYGYLKPFNNTFDDIKYYHVGDKLRTKVLATLKSK